MILHLKSRGIATGVHYMPLTMHPYFKKWYNETPVSKKIWKSFISLPLHTKLSDEDVDYIVEALYQYQEERASII